MSIILTIWLSASIGFLLGFIFAAILASGRAFQTSTQETNAPSD